MKKIVFTALLIAGFGLRCAADEGMWLLPYLQKLNIRDMKERGLKISAKEIDNLNGNSLKDAVVRFSVGCTAEIISPEGLMLTNHHCGFSTIQRHSSVERDLLQNGFWAMSRGEEIPSPGLSVTFVREIRDVTQQIASRLTDDLSESVRGKIIATLIDEIIGAELAKTAESTRKANVVSIFGGNQFLLILSETYNDVRLVGAPPQSIGKFGGETDNWMWPRHTGDFALFRIYTAPDGSPAGYAPENVPYRARRHLKISLKGFQENDFAMVIGFPGSTERYMTTYEIDQTMHVTNPNRIFIRGERQRLMMESMLANDTVRIQYASKYAASSNYWKNSIGMNRALAQLGVRSQKAALETRFGSWVAAAPERTERYGEALPLIGEAIGRMTRPMGVGQYLGEALLYGVETVSNARLGHQLLTPDTTRIDSIRLAGMRETAAARYKDYDMETDRRIARRMITLLRDSLPEEYLPEMIRRIGERFAMEGDARSEDGVAPDVARFVDWLYAVSVFATGERFEDFLARPDAETLTNDPAYRLYTQTMAILRDMSPALQDASEDYDRGHRLYIAGLMAMDAGRKFYPDANSTMRLTYGTIRGYRPRDGVIYDFRTTLAGVIAKEDPTNPYEFTVPDRLKELYAAKDYGRYAENGELFVNFLSDNDITGGNSGSPVLNGHGELIGIAFDGNWEAMTGDIVYNPELQRMISVDIRYVLFLIDKFANAPHLLDEMTIIDRR